MPVYLDAYQAGPKNTSVKKRRVFSAPIACIPKARDALVAITASVPLQLFARSIAVMRGCDVDQPRNLAKSVTVE